MILMKAYLFMSLIKMLQILSEYWGIVNPTYWCCCLGYHPMNKHHTSWILHTTFHLLLLSFQIVGKIIWPNNWIIMYRTPMHRCWGRVSQFIPPPPPPPREISNVFKFHGKIWDPKSSTCTYNSKYNITQMLYCIEPVCST